MKDLLLIDFQNCVETALLRNKSILDIASKLNLTQGKIQRCLSKSVTHCGCIEIAGKKQSASEDLDEYGKEANSQVKNHLCDDCRSAIETEIGNHLFYLAALCNALDIDMYDVTLKEKEELETLGQFSMQ